MDKVTLVLTAQELNVIGAALQEAPYKLAAPVLETIQKQVDAQLESAKPQEPVAAGALAP